MATTYAELKAEIQRWVDSDNPNFVAAIPTFIQFAEAQLSRDLRTYEMECRIATPRVPTPTPADEDLGLYDLPSDFAGFKSVDKVGDQLLILYHRRIPALSDTNTANWLLLKHPDLYLYTSLVNAKGFVKHAERLKQWAAMSDSLLESIRVADARDRHSGGPIRTRTPSERPWRAQKAGDGRYDYLPPYDLYDLDESSISSTSVCVSDGQIGFFTLADNKIQIWPRPSATA